MNNIELRDEVLKLYSQGLRKCEVGKRMRPYLPALTEKQLQDKVRRIIDCHIAKNKVEIRDSQGEVDIEEATATSQVRRHKDGTEEYSRVIVLRDGENITAQKVLEAHGLNVNEWEVITYLNNFWNSQMKGGYKLNMYQSKLFVKPKKLGLDIGYVENYFKEVRFADAHTPIVLSTEIGECDKYVEINISDLHLGKLCYIQETGENFTTEIAMDMWKRLILDIYEKIECIAMKKIVLVWCNDFFNIDNENGTTVMGTGLSTDKNDKLLLVAGVQLLTWAMELLSQLRVPIHTFYIPANHDENLSFSAIQVIKAYFKDDKNITIDDGLQARKYIKYGNTLVGYSHGKNENSRGGPDKASLLASCMPIEAKKLWSETEYHEMHAAHLHSEQMIQEINGVIVRRISSPTATDKWHAEKAFIGAVRKAQTFVYDEVYGLTDIIMTPVKPDKGSKK